MYFNTNNYFINGLAAKKLDLFLKLPHRVQELFFSIYETPEMAHFESVYGIINDDFLNLTPIEMLFLVAFNCVCEMKVNKIPIKNRRNHDDRIPLEIMISNTGLLQQETIIVGNYRYIVDFLFNGECGDFEKNLKDIKIVIECDGHEFHQKTKKQVEYDNERELNLQISGYDVIRFSGSQLYKNPFECAEKTYQYISNKILEKRAENE